MLKNLIGENVCITEKKILFCKIILKCATQGMIDSKKKSPYFETDINIQNENINFEHCDVYLDISRKWPQFYYKVKGLLFVY